MSRETSPLGPTLYGSTHQILLLSGPRGRGLPCTGIPCTGIPCTTRNRKLESSALPVPMHKISRTKLIFTHLIIWGQTRKMQLPLLLVACVLALLATQVKSQRRVCYSLTECPTSPPRYTTSDWLQAIQQANSAGMASVQTQMDEYCGCCCTDTACSQSVCGDSPVCHIQYCYKTVLGEFVTPVQLDVAGCCRVHC